MPDLMTKIIENAVGATIAGVIVLAFSMGFTIWLDHSNKKAEIRKELLAQVDRIIANYEQNILDRDLGKVSVPDSMEKLGLQFKSMQGAYEVRKHLFNAKDRRRLDDLISDVGSNLNLAQRNLASVKDSTTHEEEKRITTPTLNALQGMEDFLMALREVLVNS